MSQPLITHVRKPTFKIISMMTWTGLQVAEMFKAEGWQSFTPVFRGDQPDLVVFVGGEDVDPSLYRETKLDKTSTNRKRDQFEMAAFEEYKERPKVGICRGGQFLNVMSGGELWQDVDKHTSSHNIIDLLEHDGHDLDYLEVTSTHHQMMRPSKEGETLAIAWEATRFSAGGRLDGKSAPERPEHDTEVVWYANTNSLCFQPHPEYKPGETRTLFFQYIKYFWDMTGKKERS